MRFLAELGECFRVSTESNPFPHQLLTGARDGREAGIQRLCDLIVAPALDSVIAMSELNSCDRDIGAELL